MPVILLTARADEVDRVVGLELGRRRLRRQAVLAAGAGGAGAQRAAPGERRHRAADAGPRCCDAGGLRIDPATREVTVDGGLVVADAEGVRSPAHAGPAPRQVFSRAQLLAEVWDSAPEYQDPATVTVHVGRLRQKIEADPDDPRWITTARGVGYRFEP